MTVASTHKSLPAAPSTLPPPRLDQMLTHHFLARLARLIFRFYNRWQIVGMEHVPMSGGVLFAVNHASYIDPFLIWAALYGRRRLWGIGKSELWHSRFYGYVIDSIGCVPVHREAVDRTMFRLVLNLLAQGESVGLFPEGTRSDNGKLLPPQSGVALLAQKSGVPVIPTALIGANRVLPVHGKWPRPATLKVVFGPPLHFDKSLPRQMVTDRIMREIGGLMNAHGQPTPIPQVSLAATPANTATASVADAGASSLETDASLPVA